MKRYAIRMKDVELMNTKGGKDFNAIDCRFALSKKTMGTTNACMFRCTFKVGGFHQPHLHTKTDEFLYVVSCGDALTGIGDEIYRMEAGMFFYFPKNMLHWTKNYDKQKTLEVVTCYTETGGIEDSGYRYSGDQIPEDSEIDKAIVNLDE